MAGEAARAAPLEAYGRLPIGESIAISPDGSELAFVSNVDGKRAVVIKTVETNQVLGVLPAGIDKLRDLEWGDADHLLITASRTGKSPDLEGPQQEWYVTQSYDVVSHKFKQLMQGAENALPVVAGPLRPRTLGARHVVFVDGAYYPDGEHPQLALFYVDLQTGSATRVEDGSRQAQDWMIDSSGQVVAEVDYGEESQKWTLRLKHNGNWVDAISVKVAIDTPDVLGFSPDGSALVVRTYDTGQPVVRALALADGAWRAPPGGDAADYDYLISDPVTKRSIGGVRLTARREYVFFDAKDQAAWDKVVRAFPGEDLERESWSDDRTKIVVSVAGQRDGVAHALVDLMARRADLVGDQYKDITPDDVAPVKVVDYAAADGRKLMAYLTLPKGADAKALPLVVLPHGGPAARDEPGFDWWSQALASRGYAVLQPQFRGSDGLGWDLLNAGYGQWGRKMQTDLSDGVRDLARQGVIDPKRVCIVGGSYGGYAALAGAALDTGVYRCAVSVAGVSDLRKLLLGPTHDRKRASQSVTLRYWDRFMGSDGSKDAVLDEISPVKHIDRVTIPVLLIHGRDDTVVPFEQSQLMLDALRKAGKPVQFVELKGEDHWLSRSETRQQMLQETVKFLEVNNPPH